MTGAAQAALTVADAGKFLGVWALGLDTPQGSMVMNLTLKDEGGKVAGSISADPIMPEPQAITDISKDGTSLVMRYTLDVQGQSINAKISLVPDGDKFKAAFDFADGQFLVDGTATKK
jgi:hypothetical protein